MGGRAVEGTGLENRQGRKSFVGSNPTPSASCPQADFNEHRVAAVHRKGVEVAQPSEVVSQADFFLNVAKEGAQVHIWQGPPGTPLPELYRTVRRFAVNGAEVEVVQACGKYLSVVSMLVLF